MDQEKNIYIYIYMNKKTERYLNKKLPVFKLVMHILVK